MNEREQTRQNKQQTANNQQQNNTKTTANNNQTATTTNIIFIYIFFCSCGSPPVTTLDLSYNRLSGGIPDDIYVLENLKALKLDHNMLDGMCVHVVSHCHPLFIVSAFPSCLLPCYPSLIFKITCSFFCFPILPSLPFRYCTCCSQLLVVTRAPRLVRKYSVRHATFTNTAKAHKMHTDTTGMYRCLLVLFCLCMWQLWYGFRFFC